MATEPIDIDQVSGQVRRDVSDESDTIDIFIKGIREKCEAATRRALIVKTEVLNLSAFPGDDSPIELIKPPLRSVDSITYIDDDGDEITLVEDTDYRVIFNTQNPIMPSCIAPIYGGSWPSARLDYNSVTITYTCGYGKIDTTTVAVPTSLMQWMLLNISDLYENRETIQVDNRIEMIEIPTIADSLLSDYKVAGW